LISWRRHLAGGFADFPRFEKTADKMPAPQNRTDVAEALIEDEDKRALSFSPKQ
jgi:hypothetical protein